MTPEKRSRRARTIERAAGAAERLIRDLLDVARLEAGALVIEPKALDVASVVSEARELVSHLASKKSLTLESVGLDDVPAAYGDRDRILEALGNILGNAIKFTPRGGRVTIRARRCSEGVELCVEDTGPGIPREALARVFDRYWRAQPADRKGLGLGLAIVRGIVDAHHGRVWADSEPGKGSTFHFTIPFAPAKEEDKNRTPALAAWDEANAGGGPQPHG